MKTRSSLLIIISLLFTAGVALAADGKIKLKVGDAAYVCGCGEKCKCEVLSLKAGKCTCDHAMVKVSITKVTEDTASYEVDGKAKEIKTTGKYACACAGDCCRMISSKAGKCTCGKEMAAVAEKKAK